MLEISVIEARKEHIDFILRANREINTINSTNQTNSLTERIEKDLFGETPKFKCLIAEIGGQPVGMILYSYFYWANDGEVLWISQMFVEENYRKQGVFFALMKELKRQNKGVSLVSCATGNENKRMQRILKGYGAKEIDLKFYVIKRKENNNEV